MKRRYKQHIKFKLPCALDILNYIDNIEWQAERAPPNWRFEIRCRRKAGRNA